MEKLLAALGLSTRQTIGISVSASNIIEIICVDKPTRTIVKYAVRELKYNNAIREIISYDDFASAIEELFTEINVNPKGCNVVLNIPNVHFSFISLPLILPDEQIATAISSEVEELYLFKRHEPVISWNTVTANKETDKRYIVFGAVQENTIQNIKDIFDELGAKLLAVETSNSSMIKGIIYSRVLEEEMAANESIDILLIASNSYALFCMQGNKLVDYYEEPFAIKSFSSDEVYTAISSAAASALENYPARNLLIVSEINEVSAEILCHKINFDGNLKYLDRNMYADKSFMEISATVLPKYLPVISLEAVGAGAYLHESYPVRFNFLMGAEAIASQMVTLTLFGQDYEIDRKTLFNIALISAVIVAAIFFLIGFLITLFEKKLYKEINQMSDEFVELNAKINATQITGDVNDIYTVSRKISEENDKEIQLFFGIGSEIPSNVYLTSFFASTTGEIRIEGNSNSSESIYTYVKGLKTKYPAVKISKLQLGYGSGGSDTVYAFTIESSTAPAKEEVKGTDSANQAAAKQNPALFGGAFNQQPGATPPASPVPPAAPPAAPPAVPAASPAAPAGLPAPAAP